jgi:RNA polymerase sigma factor (sigma-70 family)
MEESGSDHADPGDPPGLDDLLAAHHGDLTRLVQARAGLLLKFESGRDIVQAVCVKALEFRDRFVYRGEQAFLSWLRELAVHCMANRRRYWSRRKRMAGRMLRISSAGGSSGSKRAVNPPAASMGPSTVANREEQYRLAMQAIPLLLPRDQKLVEWIAEGISIDEIASRLGVSYDAAERARERAISRFSRLLSLVRRPRGRGKSVQEGKG